MRRLVWLGSVVLLAACTRENGAFDGNEGGGTAATGGGDGTTRGDGVDGPQPGTGSASGSASGVDGNTADDAPPPTTGSEGTSDEATTLPPPEGTTTAADTEEGTTTSSVMETGVDPPISCCMGESCDDPGIGDCVCKGEGMSPECCGAEGWSIYCTAVAVQACDLMCIPPPGDCCEPNDVFPGCNDFGVMVCVCSVGDNAECCSEGWTDACAAYAGEHCLIC